MRVTVGSLLWVMQDLHHQRCECQSPQDVTKWAPGAMPVSSEVRGGLLLNSNACLTVKGNYRWGV